MLAGLPGLRTEEVFEMKKNKHIGAFLLIAVLIIPVPVKAEGLKKVAQSSMKWLSIPVGARASALGGAFTACSGDAGLLFWNPAGMGFSEKLSVFVGQTRWIADIQVNAGAVSVNTGRYGVIGVSLAAVQYGDLYGTRRANNASGYEETGIFTPSNFSVGIGYALKVSSHFGFGVQLKYLHEKLGSAWIGDMGSPEEFGAEMNIVALDLGTLYYTGFKDFRFGMTLQNFSQEQKYRFETFPLPLTFKFGMAMNVLSLFLDNELHEFTVSIDAVHPRDFSERLHFGGEYSLNKLFFIRAGYKINYDEENFSLGAGVNVKVQNVHANIDYSYINFEHFDTVHAFSFNFVL